MIDKAKPTRFKLPGLDNPFWEKVFQGRRGILIICLAAISTLVFDFYRYSIDQEGNFEGIDLLDISFPFFLILPALGLISLSLLETRSVWSRTVHHANLQRELNRQLMAVKDWDEVATTLFQFIKNHLPLTGLSLFVYNQSSEKYEIVDEELFGREIEPVVHSLPLIHVGKEIALLNLYILPDVSYPTAKIEMIQNLAPEVAMAIERIDSFRSFSERTLAIQKNERNRIARHLHDTIGHDLTYLCLKLDHLSSSPDHMNGFVKFHSEIESMYGIANDAVDHVRNLLSELQDENPALSSADLVSDVKECALLIGARANFQVNIKISGDPKILLPQMHRQILYLVREILRNVEKHAHAQNVTLTISWLDNGLNIKISDDGQGFDVNVSQKKDGHFGIRTVQEIVQELNGSLSMVSNQGEATQITIWLPYH